MLCRLVSRVQQVPGLVGSAGEDESQTERDAFFPFLSPGDITYLFRLAVRIDEARPVGVKTERYG